MHSCKDTENYKARIILILRTTAVVVYTVEPFGIFILIVASVLLCGRLREVHDLGGLSRDALRLGGLMLGIACEFLRSLISLR